MPQICGNAGTPPTATPHRPITDSGGYRDTRTVDFNYDIQYTTDPSGDSPFINQAVRTSGVVTAIEYTMTSNDPYVFIQDGDAPWNGLLVYVYDLSV